MDRERNYVPDANVFQPLEINGAPYNDIERYAASAFITTTSRNLQRASFSCEIKKIPKRNRADPDGIDVRVNEIGIYA